MARISLSEKYVVDTVLLVAISFGLQRALRLVSNGVSAGNGVNNSIIVILL